MKIWYPSNLEAARHQLLSRGDVMRLLSKVNSVLFLRIMTKQYFKCTSTAFEIYLRNFVSSLRSHKRAEAMKLSVRGVLAVLRPSHSCLPFTQESHKHSTASFLVKVSRLWRVVLLSIMMKTGRD